MSDQTQAFIGEGGMSLEEARALQDKLLDGISAEGVSAKINAAARLLMSGQHQDCIAAYTAIMTEHPEERGTCESQIGACYFFLKQYEKSIELYESAREHGADAEMMKDNIEEAREAIAKRDSGEEDEEEGSLLVGLLILGAIAAAIIYFVVS